MKNAKNQTLYLFTGSYPFGGVETFIENEIKHLASSFKEIIIVPSEDSDYVREVPRNVIVDVSFCILFKDKNRKIRSFFTLTFILGLLKHIKYSFSLTAIRRINSFISDSEIVFKWLKNNNIKENSIIYTYWFNGKTFGAIKFKNKYSRNLRIVSRTHRYDLYDYWFKPPFWPYRQEALNLIDKLYVISQDGIDFLKSKYKAGDNVCLSRLGITDRKTLGLTSKDDILRIVSVANLNRVKRIPLLLKYLRKIAIEKPNLNIEWTHFGDGPEMDILLKELDQMDGNNFKIFLKGRVPNSEIYEYYKNQRVDLFINISESEGVPVSIMEAQSYGKFVIATDVGGTKELILENYGFLIPVNCTFDQFRKALESFIEKKEEYISLANEIRERCIDYYDASKNYTEFTKSLLES